MDFCQTFRDDREQCFLENIFSFFINLLPFAKYDVFLTFCCNDGMSYSEKTTQNRDLKFSGMIKCNPGMCT